MSDLEKLQLRVERAKRRIGEFYNKNDAWKKALAEILHILEGRDE